MDDSEQVEMQKTIHSLERGWDSGKASNQSSGTIPIIQPTDTPKTAPSVRATRHMLIDSGRPCEATSDGKRALLISGKKWRLQSKELSCRRLASETYERWMAQGVDSPTSMFSARQTPATSDTRFPSAAAPMIEMPKVRPKRCSIDSPAEI